VEDAVYCAEVPYATCPVELASVDHVMVAEVDEGDVAEGAVLMLSAATGPAITASIATITADRIPHTT
jgi:hypothetical protein